LIADGRDNPDPRSSPVTRVWDVFVRLFHWSLVTSFGVAWFTHHRLSDLHAWAGYAAAGLVMMRLAWGILGTPYARFMQFVRGPAAVLSYLRDIAAGREARHIGHNPAGGAMVVTLLVAMIATAISGWMMTTDRYFGDDTVQVLHSALAHGILILVLLHLAGVALASFRHRENLVRAMLTGVKRVAEEGDIA
jgi:cytochrome b